MPWKMTFIVPAALLVLAAAVYGGVEKGVGDEWPVYHGDAALRGVAAISLPEKPVELWRLKAPAPVSLPPVVGGGKIYFVTDDGQAHAATLQGEKAWSARIPPAEGKAPGPGEESEKLTTPPLYARGLLLAGSGRGNLFAFDAASGKVKWKYTVGGSLLGSPNWMEPEGARGARILAVSQASGSVHCVELSGGKPAWVSKPTDRCDGSPGVGSNFVVFGNCASELQVLDSGSGAKVAQIRFPERGPVAGGVAVKGSLAFAGTRDGTLVCADAAKGRVVWTNHFGNGEAFATPAVAGGKIVCASNDGLVACLDKADGVKLWSFTCGDEPLSPAVAGDRVVVSAGGALYILNLSDGAKIWSGRPGDRISSPAVADGRIYIGTDEGFIICYGQAKE